MFLLNVGVANIIQIDIDGSKFIHSAWVIDGWWILTRCVLSVDCKTVHVSFIIYGPQEQMLDHNMVDKNGLELERTIRDHRPVTVIKWETKFWLIAIFNAVTLNYTLKSTYNRNNLV